MIRRVEYNCGGSGPPDGGNLAKISISGGLDTHLLRLPLGSSPQAPIMGRLHPPPPGKSEAFSNIGNILPPQGRGGASPFKIFTNFPLKKLTKNVIFWQLFGELDASDHEFLM